VCQPAKDRLLEFNIYYVPTVYFDGGAEVFVGSSKTEYTNRINACAAMPVYDVDVAVEVQWLGNATMNITATVKNNEASTYEGHIRVYVTEIISSLGWQDTNDVDYTHPFLDWAFNDSVTIPAGGTWEDTVLWDGNQHSSGMGQTYGSVTVDNVRVIAAVFNDDQQQGYSVPPSGNPFDAYYCDDVAVSPLFSFYADAYTLPESGGTVNLELTTGMENQMRNYLIVAGVTGTSPGYPLPGGMTLPINWDLFSGIVMGMVNTPPFTNFMGKTNFLGNAGAQLNAPALPPGTAGLILYFAFCMNNPFDFVSNPIQIEVVP
jgi:hypothetical protein